MKNLNATLTSHSEAKVARGPLLFSQLGAATSKEGVALTVSVRSVMEDRGVVAHIAIAGVSEAEVTELGRGIALRAVKGAGVNGGLLQRESPACFAISTRSGIIGLSSGSAAIYVAKWPVDKVGGPLTTINVDHGFSGYIYLLDRKLSPEELERLRTTSRHNVYPKLIAEEYAGHSKVAMAILGVRIPFAPTQRLRDLRVNEASSHRGMRRANNEDSVLASRIVYSLPGKTRSFSILMVADGAGGHMYGEVASEEAVIAVYKVLLEALSQAEDLLSTLKRGLDIANERVLKFRRETRSDAATTLTAALIEGGRVYAAHCGDSRIYIVGREITQVTEDHKYVTELVKRGLITEREAKYHPQRNVITSALGMEKPRVDLFTRDLGEDEILLLCTDGLSDVVEDWEIQSCVLRYKVPKEISSALINLANARGGPDNVSVALSIPFTTLLRQLPHRL